MVLATKYLLFFFIFLTLTLELPLDGGCDRVLVALGVARPGGDVASLGHV